MQFGTKLGLDTWADTSCAGRHAYVESFIEGKVVSAGGFSPSVGKLNNIPIANVLYACDLSNGSVVILENCHAIYLGESMNDSLLNPLQAEDSNVRIDTQPKRFYPNEDCQRILFEDGTIIPIEFDGVLPYISVRRPTSDEIHNCRRLSLTNQDEWNPHSYNGLVSLVDSHSEIEHSVSMMTLDPVSYVLSFEHTFENLYDYSIFPGISNLGDDFYHISAMQSNAKSKLQPQELSKMWNIGLSTAKRTLEATTHKCYRTTGLLSRRFKTDVAQLRFKQMSRQYGTFYCDYLKSNVKSLRGFIGGTVYTNKTWIQEVFSTCR